MYFTALNDIKNQVYIRMKEMEYASESNKSELDPDYDLLTDVHKILNNLVHFIKTL